MADGVTELHLFVATLTAAARGMLTTFEGEHFTVEQYGGERFRFAVPKCVVGPHSFTISNWSPDDFKLFFDVTETPEWYLPESTREDSQEPHVSDRQ